MWDITPFPHSKYIFFGYTCLRAAADEEELLNSEKGNVVDIGQSTSDLSNAMFTEAFLSVRTWKSFSSMLKDTIHKYDSVHLRWTPMHGRQLPQTSPATVIPG